MCADQNLNSTGKADQPSPPPPPPSPPNAGPGLNQRSARRRLSFEEPQAPIVEEKVIWDVGDIIAGRYEVTGIAGKGGMGVVYKVHHREWNIDMAVKTPLPALVKDNESKARFLREAQTWVDLGLHPNLVQCWYVRELGGLPRLFVDFMHGGSLRDWSDNGQIAPGNWGAIIDVIVQACDGLGYAHERGVIHRDVKPANMLMTADGRLCVTDFGLVKVEGAEEIVSSGAHHDPAQASDGLTLTGSNMGTPQYGAPEQWGGARHVDARADIYALAVSLFELCCLRRPFDDRGTREPPHVIIGRQITQAPPDPRTFRPDVPEVLARIILQALAKNPDERPPSMRAFRETLAAAYQQILGQPFAREIPEVAQARAAALNNRAVSMWDLGRPDEAAAAWAEALKLDPQHAESLYNHHLLDWRGGRLTDADVQHALLEAARTDKRARLYLGQVQLESCAAPETEATLQAAMQDAAVAQGGPVWRALGHAQMAQEKFEAALASYTQALERMPGDATAQDCLSLSRARTRRRGNALLFPALACAQVISGRTGSVRAIAIAADGRRAIADGSLGAVSQWDLVSCRLVCNFSGHSRPVLCVAITPDGKFALSGSDDSTLRMWNLATNRPVEDFFGKGHIGAVQALATTPDSSHAVSGGGDQSLRLWELSRGYLIRIFRGHERSVNAVAVTPDGKFVLSAADDATVRRWDLQSGECAAVYQDGLKAVKALALSRDGRWLVSGGLDGTLFLWDLASGQRVRAFSGHRGAVLALALTPDARFVVSGGDDHTLRLWEAGTGRCLRTFTDQQGPVQALALTPDGRACLSGSAESEGNPLRLWKFELDNFAPSAPSAVLLNAALVVCRVENQVQAQAASKQFETLLAQAQGVLASGDAGSAYRTLKQARAVAGYERDPRAVALHTDLSSRLTRTRLSSGLLRLSLEPRHPRSVCSLALCADGRHALSAGQDDKLLCYWELGSGLCVRRLEGHKHSVHAVALSARGDVAVSGAGDYLVGLWELPAGKCLRLCEGHSGEVHCVALRPDSRGALSGSSDGTLRLWEVPAGKCARTLDAGDKIPVRAVAVLQDNRMAASGHEDGAVRLWSLLTGQCLKTFIGHSGAVTGLAATPDGRFVLSAAEDKTLRVWSADSGQAARVLKSGNARFGALAVTPDSRFVFSGGLEGPGSPLRLWELATGACVYTSGPHPKGISALALSPDGCLLLSGSEDQVIRIWDLEWELDEARMAAALKTINATLGPTGGAPLPPASSTKDAKKRANPANPFGF